MSSSRYEPSYDYNTDRRVYRSKVTGQYYVDAQQMERDEMRAMIDREIKIQVERQSEKNYFEQYRDPFGKRFR